MNASRTVVVLLILLLVSLAGNLFFVLRPETICIQSPVRNFPEMENTPAPQSAGAAPIADSGLKGYAKLQGPAVIERMTRENRWPYTVTRTELEGTMIDISLELREGRGRVLVETKPLMGVVFQDSARTAVSVAENVTGVNLGGTDAIYSIEAQVEIPAVDGPSAGALMAVLAYSAMTSAHLREDVTITGTIAADGRIGKIGGVVEKAMAAREAGKVLILLPRENARMVTYLQSTRTVGRFTYQQSVPVEIDAKEYIEEHIGIGVEYVEEIGDALGYMLQERPRAPEG